MWTSSKHLTYQKLGYLFCDGACAVHRETKTGYKVQRLLYYGYLALQSRDASVHPLSSALRSSPGGIMGWIMSPYSSLGSPWLSWTSNISVSRSHQPLTHPPFGRLTVQVHLQLRLFSRQLFVFPSARQSAPRAASPRTPAIHSHPSSFQTPPKYHKSSLHQRSGHQTIHVPDSGKKLRSGTWKLWESFFFVMEMEQNPPVIIC